MALAHVICCNDFPEAVVVGGEDFARAELERFILKHAIEHGSFPLKHRTIYDWHIKTVPLIEEVQVAE